MERCPSTERAGQPPDVAVHHESKVRDGAQRVRAELAAGALASAVARVPGPRRDLSLPDSTPAARTERQSDHVISLVCQSGAPAQMTGAEGVLFDFSGTLFFHEFETQRIRGADPPHRTVPEGKVLLARLRELEKEATRSADIRDAWEKRDLLPEMHRSAYLTLLEAAGAAPSSTARQLYEQIADPSCWRPYPDTLPSLRLLAAANIPVAVVSNISWDIRKVFELHSALHLVSAVVMSYREGVTKPHPRIFLDACARLGVPPEKTLMIGDDQVADGGAATVGISVALVPPAPVYGRPRGLLDALAAHGLA